MKLTISPADGTITVETPDNVSAAQFVRELMTGGTAAPPKQIESVRVKKARKPRKKLAPPKADRPLSKQLDETWAFLAASEPDGVTAAEVAQAFKLSPAGGLYRINALIKRDMAWEVSPGRYRVGSITDGTVITNGNGVRAHS